MNKHPRHTAFRSQQDLIDLRTQLFHSSPKDQLRAIQRIHTLETRTRLPHLLQSTAYLLEIHNSFANGDDTVLRLSSTMCLIRFVNGLLDPSQQSTFAIPLNVLAKKIGLPNWFVELRHSGTHESLPSLEMLEVGVIGALDWIKVNYWGKIDVEEVQEVVEDDVDVDWKDVIRRYRRIRRNDINKFIKFGDSSEEGKEYWSVVKELESGVKSEGFYKVLMFKNCMINEKYKWEQLKLLFEPLFLYLIKHHDEFVYKLVDKMMFKKYEYEKFKLLNMDQKDQYNINEIKQLEKWIVWIVEHVLESQVLKIVEIIDKIKQDFGNKLYRSLQTKWSENKQIQSLINTKLNQNNSISKQARPMDDIDDVFEDLENLKKRAKLIKTYPIKIFETYTNWEPKPFGILQ